MEAWIELVNNLSLQCYCPQRHGSVVLFTKTKHLTLGKLNTIYCTMSFGLKQLFNECVSSGWILSFDLGVLNELFAAIIPQFNPQVNPSSSLKLSPDILPKNWKADFTDMLAYLLAFRTKSWWLLSKKALSTRDLRYESDVTESLIRKHLLCRISTGFSLRTEQWRTGFGRFSAAYLQLQWAYIEVLYSHLCNWKLSE